MTDPGPSFFTSFSGPSPIKLSAKNLLHSRFINGQRYPTRDDYEACSVGAGFVLYPHDAWSNPAFVLAAQRHWFGLGQCGCLFAQQMVKKYDAWTSVVCTSPGDRVGLLVKVLDELIDREIQSPQCELLSVLFPAIETVTELMALLKCVSRLERASLLAPKRHAETIGLSFRMDVGRDGCQSWVLGFGPFDCLPLTRQSPITEILFRTKPHEILSCTHVADASVEPGTERSRDLWNASVERRQSILGNEAAPFARARFTFCVPDGYAGTFYEDEPTEVGGDKLARSPRE